MKSVRFKIEYTDVPDVRMSYELEDEQVIKVLGIEYYNTKLLGLIPIYKMEQSEDTDISALDVFVKLSNL